MSDAKVVLEPLGNYVVIELIREEEKTTPGGIILPDAARPKPTRATVIAVGPGFISNFTGQRIPPCVEVGDVVLINQNHGGSVLEDIEGYGPLVLMAEGDILSKLKYAPVEDN